MVRFGQPLEYLDKKAVVNMSRSLRVFIFNPNSKRFKRNRRRLLKLVSHAEVKLPPTLDALSKVVEQAIHSEETPQINIGMGDGGKHRVINYIMKARDQIPGKRVRVAFIPLGNANDGYMASITKRIPGILLRLWQLTFKPRLKPILKRVFREGDVRKLDLIRLRVEDEDMFAHSYVGFGVLATAARLLNSRWRNRLTEIPLVLWALFAHYRPVVISRAGKKVKLAALLVMNGPRMAKVLWVSPESKTYDGVLEVLEVPSKHFDRIRLLLMAIQAFRGKPLPIKKLQAIPFQLVNDAEGMADGETFLVAAGSLVLADCEPGALDQVV